MVMKQHVVSLGRDRGARDTRMCQLLNHQPPGGKQEHLFKPAMLPFQIRRTQTYFSLKCHYNEPALENLHNFDKIRTSDIKIKGQKNPVWQSSAGLVWISPKTSFAHHQSQVHMSKLFKIWISFNECDLSFPRCLDLGALRVHLLLFWFAEFLIWLHFKGGLF